MAYKRMTKEDRIHIHRWRQEGLSFREIARLFERSPSTICREVTRNTGRRGYRAKQAHHKAQERARRPGPRRFTPEIRKDVERQLRNGWTPEIISGRAWLENRACVSRETIYKFIYRDAKAGGDLWKNLPRSRRKRSRRCPRQDGRGRGRIPNQRMIDTRPAEVETRKSIGHWEGDLINGAHGTGNLVTMVERKFRFLLVGKTDTKEAEEVTETICRLFEDMPEEVCQSSTYDNGKEFSMHEVIASTTGMDVFFAMPYQSWERGTNENTNGLVSRSRELHPQPLAEPDLCREYGYGELVC